MKTVSVARGDLFDASEDNVVGDVKEGTSVNYG